MSNIYWIISGKYPLLKQLFIQFVIVAYQVISIIKNLFWRNVGRITLEFKQKNSMSLTVCHGSQEFSNLSVCYSINPWNNDFTSTQTYAVLFKKNWKLLETKYSVVIV
jgi:hypothetical protein